MHSKMQFINVIQKLIFRQPVFSVNSSFRNKSNIELVLKRLSYYYQCKSSFFSNFLWK